MNHAFLIIAHNYPELLGETVKILQAPNHYFFINIDKKNNDTPFKESVRGLSNVFFTEDKDRVSVNWGGWSQISTEIKLLKFARSKQNLDYYHLISGQDFPCQSNFSFDEFFIKHNGESFMFFDKEEEAMAWRKNKYPDRYRLYHFNDLFFINEIISKILRRVLSICVNTFLPKRKEIDNIAGGWNWFSWHRSVANYILDFLNRNPDYIRRFHYTSCCDELFFHTILNDHTDKLRICRNDALRFIEWHPKRETKTLPLILNENEYDDIIKSKAFFCRKIKPGDSLELIQLLKRNVLNI